VAFPEVQEKLRQEVDAVVGEQVPKTGDPDGMPYLQAFLQEVSLHLLSERHH
jgi:hypothetical protein